MTFIEIVLYGLFLRTGIYHVRRRQYLQGIFWLIFMQVLVQALDLAEFFWSEQAAQWARHHR